MTRKKKTPTAVSPTEESAPHLVDISNSETADAPKTSARLCGCGGFLIRNILREGAPAVARLMLLPEGATPRAMPPFGPSIDVAVFTCGNCGEIRLGDRR
jgi:hypothetical protein